MVILLAMLLASVACAFALDPSLDVSQYAHTTWKIREGFTKGTIFSVAQTPDGYLWLGTEFGLVRFDGVRAIPWQPPEGQQLPSNYIRALLVSRDDTLWIGTSKGLASWKNGKLAEYAEVGGHPAGPLLQDGNGTIWVGIQHPGRLCNIQAETAKCYGAGSFGDEVLGLYADRKGNLWVAAQTGLWRWAPGPPRRYDAGDGPVEPRALIDGDKGAILVATGAVGGPPTSTIEGLEEFEGGKFRGYVLPGIAGTFRPTCLFRSSDGSLWVGTVGGLLHEHQGKVDRFNHLSGDTVTGLFEDREGSVWVSTEDGLDRFRAFPISTISVSQGLSSSTVHVVKAMPDGSIWIATTDGLDRWQNGQVTIYGKQSVPSPGLEGDEQSLLNTRATEIANSGLKGGVYSLGQDDRGRLWAGSPEGVFFFDGRRFLPVRGVPAGNIFSIAAGEQGNVWISNLDKGLIYSGPEGVVQRTPWAGLGHKSAAAAMLPDPVRGGLWLGFLDGGIIYLKEGQIRASYSTADGLGNGAVTNLQLGSYSAVWAATEGGLSRLKDGRVTTLTSKNGLPCDAVHWAMEDNDHSIWLNQPCGLVRIVRSELDAWVSDPKRNIQATVFDSSDGVRTRISAGRFGPKVTKSIDGRIWFSPLDGVSSIDPLHLAFNKLPPPVHIEQVIADGKTYWQSWSGDASSSPPKLPPLVRDLTIDYTALSLVVPEKVHFRFKLEGQDKDWREVVNQRRVEYSNLPPRHYRFRVMASNNSGVWNEQGTALDFTISPAYYQTNWFRALCVAAFLALVWAVYRLRVRQVREQEKKFREAVESMPALAFIVRPDGYRTFVNQGWIRYTGLTLEQGSGSGWQAAVHPDDLNRVVTKWQASLPAGEPLEYETRLRRLDGEYRWFLTRAVPVRDRRGKIVKWVGAATDIEDRKRAEQLQLDLAHVNRVTTLGELAASIAHELKQPIAAAMTNAKTGLRWLKRDQPDMEEASEAMERIVKDNARAADIIDRLRSLYKKSPTQRESLDVNEIVQEMVALLRGEANRHAVSIRADLAADLPKVMADRVQAQQVLMNIMLNGIEAMKEAGGVLTVKSQLGQDGQVLISISDTGVGLPEEKADQIFSAFFTTKPQGSGMGLAISRSIVESHGGRLWATPNDGRGATFHFTLPTASEEMKLPAAET